MGRDGRLGLEGPRIRAGPSVRIPPGWDISSLNLAEAMRRAKVLDWGLQEQLWPHMEALRPRPSVYIPEFIAANQSARADNLIPGSRAQQVLSHPASLAPCHLSTWFPLFAPPRESRPHLTPGELSDPGL